MKFGRHGIVAALLGCVLSLALHSIPDERACPQGPCAFSAPTAVRGVASAPNWLQVSWNRVPKASSYRVQVAPANNFVGDEVITVLTPDPERPKPLVIPNLDPGTTYHVRVSVVGRSSDQQSEWSAPATYMTKGPMQLAVGTYNIHNPGDDWDERGPFVAAGILGEKLHVLGVQEVYRADERRSLLDLVNARSKAVYGAPVYSMAPGPDSDLGYDNRILYDTRVLQLTKWGGREYEHQVGDGEVDRWFAWATFTHRPSGWNVLFVTTHLAPDNDRADLRQWSELVWHIRALKRITQAHWVVVAGDFNTTKLEKPADVMLPEMYKRGFGDVLGQQYDTYEVSGARAKVKKDAHLRSFNGFREDTDDYSRDEDENGNGVDWIFASNQLAVPYYRVVARYDDDGELIEPIPSDHFLVRATLEYVPPQADESTVKVAATVKPGSED
ncbi:MAG TPA: endonuclease/exonuclease/phosphatase family protein [Aeromicrobium sp.]|nr:endonuclease/exonuclease/phosphatase family protein [Aeromicrobium sp.]